MWKVGQNKVQFSFAIRELEIMKQKISQLIICVWVSQLIM
jgi:hypothetical protein